MNRNVIIVILVIVLLLLGVGGYFFLKNSHTTSNGQDSGSMMESSPKGEPSSMKSLKDLLTAGTSQKCTFSEDKGTTSVNGTTYISGGKIRSDYGSTASGVTTNGHMITDGKTSYVWMDGQSTGYMMAIPSPSTDNNSGDTSSSNSGSSASQGIDPNKQMNYSCSGWSADASLFTPPANVKFSDFSKMMAAPSGSANSQQCAACNSLTGDSKTQCLAVLHCTQ